MLPKKFALVNSELRGSVDPDAGTITIEPNDRIRGFGVAMELSEAIEFAKMVLEMDAYLQAEFNARWSSQGALDDIGRDESLTPYLV